MDAHHLRQRLRAALCAGMPTPPSRRGAYTLATDLGDLQLRRDGTHDWGEPQQDTQRLVVDHMGTSDGHAHGRVHLRRWVDISTRWRDGSPDVITISVHTSGPATIGYRLQTRHNHTRLVLRPGRPPLLRRTWRAGATLFDTRRHGSLVTELIGELTPDERDRVLAHVDGWFPGMRAVELARIRGDIPESA